MIVGFIGDIVGKPGREMIKEHLLALREEFLLDLVIANGENASHGFGVSYKNANELFSYGIDCITGGNHIWDKKDIVSHLETLPIVRPLNYPDGVPGVGVRIINPLAIINLMGHFTMPMVSNPFIAVKEEVKRLKNRGVRDIFIDFHAEATSEKNALFAFLKGEVSAICGTHTHVGTDDMVIDNGTFYVSDVGLTGCRDAVIGMDTKAPLKRFLTGLPAPHDIPKKCKKILQMVILEIKGGECLGAKKVKIYDDKDEKIIQKAFME